MSELFEAEARIALRTCDEQTTFALDALLQAIHALEDLPKIMSCDREGDARSKAMRWLHEAFVSVYRAEIAAQRARAFS